jgi:rsbT antagonist protein RsbS
MSSVPKESIPIQVSRGCVVASVQVDLCDEVINHLRTDLLEKIQLVRARAVILDLSGLEIMDPLEFEQLTKTLDMARLMGATPVISGLKPSIIASLSILDTDLAGVNGTLDLDHAFTFIEQMLEPEEQDRETELSESDATESESQSIDDDRPHDVQYCDQDR